MADDEQHPGDRPADGDHPTEGRPGPDRPAPGPDGDETQRVVTGDETSLLPAGETASSHGDETTERPGGDTAASQGDETTEWPGGDNAASQGDETTVLPASETAPSPGDETAVLSHGGEKTGASQDDETQAPAGGDETQVLNTADATQVLANADATQVIANGDQTAVIPPQGGRPAPGVDQTAVLPPMPAWAGRAEVRRPDAGGVRQAVPPDEWQDYEDSGRRWWLPIVLGILGLLMLAVLGAGVWLIMRTQNEKPAPATSATSTASARPSQTSASPSPTTASPSPTASGPAQVLVPPLVGLTADQAETLLQQNHLNFQLLYRYDPNTPVGNVIEANPVVGTLVDQGSNVTLVISSAASSSPSPSANSVSPSARSVSPTS
jgi:hypothetical protein